MRNVFLVSALVFALALPAPAVVWSPNPSYGKSVTVIPNSGWTIGPGLALMHWSDFWRKAADGCDEHVISRTIYSVPGGKQATEVVIGRKC